MDYYMASKSRERPKYRERSPGHNWKFMNKMGLPGGSVVKNPPATAGDVGSIPGLGRSPGEGHGNPLRYSCLENPMSRGAWWATVHGVSKSQKLSN